jgi:phosphoribosylglycinamide formyltransferase-1
VSEAAPVGVLVSGGGRSLENLAEVIARGELAARIALVLSDRPGIGALERAQRLGIPWRVVRWTGRAESEAFSVRVFEELDAHGCRLAVLAGFLRLLRLPERWRGRVLNVHPALLPAFGGKGYWGEHVHRAVLASGVATTGCTVHLVDDQYDHGPVLLQRRVPVQPGDTVASLAARVFEEERRALPEALRRLLAADPAPG